MSTSFLQNSLVHKYLEFYAKMGAGTDGDTFHYIPTAYVVLGLSFIGGFVDATGYIKLFGLFTSSITGNLVVGCTDFFKESEGVFARMFVSLAFALGAYATTVLTVHLHFVLKQSNWDRTINLFCCEIAALFVAFLFGICVDYSADEFPDLNSWQSITTGSLLAFSMGVHNGAAQDVITNCPSTTVMTMTIVKTAMAGANAVQFWLASKSIIKLYPLKEGKADDYDAVMHKNYLSYSTKFFENVKPLIFFVLGATLGAVMVIHMSFWNLFLPILMLGILVQSVRMSRTLHNCNTHEKLEQEQDMELSVTRSPIIQASVLLEEEELEVVHEVPIATEQESAVPV